MFVGTIHGFCLNLLQSPPLYRYLKYRVLDDIQQRLLIDRYSTQSGLTNVPLLNGGTLSRWQDSSLYQKLIAIYHEDEIHEALIPQQVHDAVRQYHDLLHEHYFLDYTFIIREAVLALETNPELKTLLAERLRYLVVDEYQDVNPLQEKLICLLFELGANLCVVGDDDQTIYQWRGSDVRNIITFAERYPDVVQIRLNENFRSSHSVIDPALAVIERTAERLAKKMVSTNAQPFAYGNTLALHFASPEEEAAWIAGKIKYLYGSQYEDSLEAAQRAPRCGPDYGRLGRGGHPLRSRRHERAVQYPRSAGDACRLLLHG